jgi:hypothetical protein
MKCEECRRIMDQLVEGELNQRAVPEVSAHLAACLACDRCYQFLIREQKMFRQCLLTVEAAPTLWDGLRSQIEELNAPTNRHSGSLFERARFPFRTPRLNLLSMAALALIIVGVTVGMVRYLSSRETMTQRVIAQRNANVNIPPSSVSSPMPSQMVVRDQTRTGWGPGLKSNQAATESKIKSGLMAGSLSRKDRTGNRQINLSNRTPVVGKVVLTTEQQYLAAINMLSGNFERRRSQFDPNELVQLRSALAQLDRTIVDTRRAVRENPGNPILVQYMMSAYAKKVEVLKQLAS